jgi:pimeloyl-ACP methyl ester carboxylesterase
MIYIYSLIHDKLDWEKRLFPITSLLILTIILIMNGWSFPAVNAQTQNCTNLESTITLPVLLIHGWNEGNGGEYLIHFDEWKQALNQDMIPYCIISFKQSNDACGSSLQHARELSQIVQNIKSESGQNQVNIVGFSKGGLDARVYLASNLANDDVANLIMVGTPNAGSPLAKYTNDCWPAIKDIRPDSPATQSRQNIHTQYYTIAGTCLGIGDQLVLVSSVNSQPYFHQLGTTDSCHAGLLGPPEYELAYPILIGGQ